MVTLNADNQYVVIKGASKRILRKLEKITSYKVAGAYFSEAYRRKAWDGREHLLKFNRKVGYRAPVGLLNDIIAELDRIKARYKLKLAPRKVPAMEHVFYPWNTDIKLRPYQLEAIAAASGEEDWDVGRGILKMPIRSGKTKTAAALICDLSVRTIFLVDSQMLLHQTRKALKHALQIEVGIIGDSEWDEQDVTVATIQTLARAREKKDKRYKRIIKHYPFVIFDECHHLKGDVYHAVMMEFDAPYKIGLSATVYLEDDREAEKGVIWLKACCGDICIDIPTSRLIDEGWLMRPQVELYPVHEPDDIMEHRWSASLQDAAIYTNDARNRLIAELAAEQVAERLTVLIVSNRLNQVKEIAELLEEYDLNFAAVTGNDSSDVRQARVAEFIEGDIDVLIGTVFSEGIDIPEIECVINAEGGRDIKATVQRMRNLTPNEGKEDAVFIDFLDMMNPYFAKHSKERLEVYRSEPAFKVRAARR